MKLPSLLILIVLISTSTFSQNYKFGKVSKQELQEKSHPIEPTANAAILYREYKTNFQYSEEEGFVIMTDVFERIKIYKKEGFNWATKEVNRYQGTSNDNEVVLGLKAYTYYLNESGKIEEIKLRNDGIFEEEATKFRELTKFTMPGIKEGCIIEYKYTLKSPFISNIDSYRFQESVPINKMSFKFTAPEYFNYKPHQKGWLFFKIVEGSKERTVPLSSSSNQYGTYGVLQKTGAPRSLKFREDSYAVNLNNVSSIIEEVYVGNMDNYSASLKMELSFTKFPNSIIEYYSSTWEDVSKSIYLAESFGGQLKKTNYFDDDIDALLDGVSNPMEKGARIFDFVKNRMTWNGYSGFSVDLGVQSAYIERKGNAADINLMLTAMFRYAGLNANPILVSTKAHGIPVFPTRVGFNYVISGVEIDNNILLFDASNKDGEVGILETKLLNWRGRIIRKDGSSSWVSLTPKEPAVQNTFLAVSITEDLTIKGSSQNLFSGHYSMTTRDQFANVNEDTKRKIIEKGKGETEVSNIKFENLEVLNQPIKLSYDFESFDTVEQIDGKLYFSPLLFLSLDENPFKPEKRNYPVDFNYPKKDRYIVTVNIPEGYSVESKPENSSIGLEQSMGSFKYNISSIGNKIQLSLELSINEPLIPAEMYGGLKKFYQMLINKENEKVVLLKT